MCTRVAHTGDDSRIESGYELVCPDLDWGPCCIVTVKHTFVCQPDPELILLGGSPHWNILECSWKSVDKLLTTEVQGGCPYNLEAIVGNASKIWEAVIVKQTFV